jgi:hypothetical protein
LEREPLAFAVARTSRMATPVPADEQSISADRKNLAFEFRPVHFATDDVEIDPDPIGRRTDDLWRELIAPSRLSYIRL